MSTTAFAVAATTAIFTVVNALWFRPLDVHDPATVAVVYRTVAGATGPLLDWVSAGSAKSLAELSTVEGVTFELNTSGHMVAWEPVVREQGGLSQISATAVAANYFETLGVPVQGRTFKQSDDVPGAEPVAIVSRRYWKRLAVDHAPGQAYLRTTAADLRIVGVADSGFTGPRLGATFDVWIPFAVLPRFSDVAAAADLARLTPVTVFARLKHDDGLRAAEAEVRAALTPDASLRPLREVAYPLRGEQDLLRQEELLRTMWIAAGVVLAIAWVNLASLLLARVEQRRSELAVRLALGCSPGRLSATMAAEALLIAAGGIVLGLMFREALIASIERFTLPNGLRLDQLHVALDLRIVMFACAVAIAAVGGAVLAATREARRINLLRVIAAPPNSATARIRRQVLLAIHVALSVALLVAATALVRSIATARMEPVGFDRDRTLLVELRPRLTAYNIGGRDDASRRLTDYRELIDYLASLDGIRAVAPGQSPVHPGTISTSSTVYAAGQAHTLTANFMKGGPNYAAALGAELIAGRDFHTSDSRRFVHQAAALARRLGRPVPSGAGDASSGVAIVDAAFASSLWPEGDALGRTFSWEPLRIDYEVIGIVRRLPGRTSLHRQWPTAITFQPLDADDGSLGLALVLGTSGYAREATAAVRDVVASRYPDAAFVRVRAAGDAFAEQMAQEVTAMRIFVWYGAISGLLAFGGIYGLVAYFAAKDRREAGIRLALGASGRQVRRVVIGRAMRPVLAGGAMGVLLAATGVGLFDAAIVGLARVGPLAYAGAVSLFVTGALVAATRGSGSLESIELAELFRAD
ncbi:MAG TPA: ABC transporter permease [Vicinamibacterales bacterium]